MKMERGAMNQKVGLWISGTCACVNVVLTYVQLTILENVPGTLLGLLLVTVCVVVWNTWRHMGQPPCA